jgi:hypothetical protein
MLYFLHLFGSNPNGRKRLRFWLALSEGQRGHAGLVAQITAVTAQIAAVTTSCGASFGE